MERLSPGVWRIDPAIEQECGADQFKESNAPSSRFDQLSAVEIDGVTSKSILRGFLKIFKPIQ